MQGTFKGFEAIIPNNTGPLVETEAEIVANEAIQILFDLAAIYRQRGRDYSSIIQNSRVSIGILNAMGVQYPIGMSETQVNCLTNIAGKVSRITTGDPSHEDSWIDTAGYAILAVAAARVEKRAKDKAQAEKAS